MRDMFRVGTITGAGTVPMNRALPRPRRDGAVTVLEDAGLEYVDVQGTEHISVGLLVDVSTATINLQVSVAQDPTVGPWHEVDTTAALDGSITAASDLLVAQGAFRWARVVVEAGAGVTTVTTATLYAW